jgi:hypothetical protein
MSHLKDSNLAQLIRLLKPEEYKKLEAWLASPWANSNKKLLPFCRLLLQHAPAFDSDALKKERIFKKMYPGKSYNNKSLNNLITECTRQVESFLVHESILTENQQTDLLRQEMLKRENAKAFGELSMKLIQGLENQPVLSADEHRQLALLYLDLYYQPFEHFRYHAENDLLGSINQHLDAYYALTKCKLWQEARDQSAIIRKNNNPAFAGTGVFTNPQLLEFFEQSIPNPAIKIYGQRLRRTAPINWEDFLEFQHLYDKHFDLLPPDLQRNFYFYCLNDLIRLDNLGFEQAVAETFKLYQIGLQRQLLFEHQQMSGVTYNNIIMAASYLDEVAFTENFIKTYTPYLLPERKEEAHTWASGQLAYMKQEYAAAQRILGNHKFKHDLFRIQSRITLLKTYYEDALSNKSNLDLFLSYCLSSEQFFSRGKFLVQAKNQSYIRLIQLMKRLATLALDKNTSAAKWKKLSREIHAEKNLTGKNWLLKKITGLYA